MWYTSRMKQLAFLICAAGACLASDVTFEFAADGEAPATAALQAAVDKASASGGGTVRVPAGKYVVAGICLKDNVTLTRGRCCSARRTTSTTRGVRSPS